MQNPRLTPRRLLVLGATVAALVMSYSAASNAIVFGAPAADHAEGEAAPATDPTAVGTVPTVEIDEARLLAGLEAYKEASCRNCHGWAANGEREGPNPQGPSLRATMLPMDIVRLTIACGRPGTEMPYFWRDAYRRDSTECYGTTGADLGDRIPLRGGARFNDQQLDDLAYYIEYYIKGQGEDITFEECEFYWGEGNTRCDFYR